MSASNVNIVFYLVQEVRSIWHCISIIIICHFFSMIFHTLTDWCHRFFAGVWSRISSPVDSFERWSVENHTEEMKSFDNDDVYILNWLENPCNISHAVNNNGYIRKWLGKLCIHHLQEVFQQLSYVVSMFLRQFRMETLLFIACKMLFHTDLTFHFLHNNFQFLQHDFQHGSSWIEFDSSLWCVENHTYKLKLHY